MRSRLRLLDDAALREWRRLRSADSPWDWVASLVTRRPGTVLLTTLALLSIPLLALPTLTLDHDTLAQLPADAESVRGFQALAEHIPEGELEPLLVIIDTADVDVWEPEAFHALGVLSMNLKLLDGVTSVRSVAMPTNGAAPDEVDTDVATEEIDALAVGLDEAGAGARAIAGGVEELLGGLVAIERELPELVGGLDAAREGAGRIAAAIGEAQTGVRELGAGSRELRRGAEALDQALGQLLTGLEEARDGAATLRDEVAVPAEAALRRGYGALAGMTVGRLDPMYETAATELGEAYARITGEYPPGHPQAGQRVEDDYDGLEAALDELASGLSEAAEGVEAMGDGVRELAHGMRELERGLAELDRGLGQVGAGAAELHDGLGAAVAGANELHTGVGAMRAAVEEELLPGARELAVGLEDGAREIRAVDLEALIGVDGIGPFVISPHLLAAQPELRDELEFFVAEDGTRTRIFIGTEKASYTDEAMAVVDDIVDIARLSLSGSPIADAQVLPTGPTAFLAEMDEIAVTDFWVILIAVVVGIFIVLAMLLRSLVAPAYMVASVMFSFLVALGMGTFVFQHLLGHDGLAWYLPAFLFVLLVALGIDYSIFLMSRVREEAHRRSTVDAVAYGIRLTGPVITSAGLILAGTFGALAVAPLTPLAQIGFTVSFGILIDTYVVRSFLVPSAAVLLRHRNWWPSRLARDERERASASPHLGSVDDPRRSRLSEDVSPRADDRR